MQRTARASRSRLVIASVLLCAAVPRAHAAECPNVHFVVDRSASMASKWIFATDSIRRVTRQRPAWPMGLSMFPSTGCDTEIAVRPALGTQASISSALDAKTPKGSTATATAIRTTAQLAELANPARAQFLVLITDGAPGCGTTDTVDTTLQELANARQQNQPVFTFVVGLMLFNPAHAATLSRMADAGGRAAPTPERFYRAESPFELDAALEAIQARILAETPGCVMPAAPPDLGASSASDLGACSDPAMSGGAGTGSESVGCTCSVTERRPRPFALTGALALLIPALLLGRRRLQRMRTVSWGD